MRVAMLVAHLRIEEKMLVEAFRARGVDLQLMDVRSARLDLHNPGPWAEFDVVLERCISHSRALAVLRVLDSWGVKCVNPFAVAELCGDKLATSLALIRHDVPTPGVRMALTPESALDAIDELGYPAVLKPSVGSWGRLIARINDRDAAEALLEHKATLGTYHHSIFYIQEHIEKGGRDLRTFVINDETICGISRTSEHWITNTARGGRSAALEITPEIDAISRAAAKAVGGGIVAIDLFETADRGLLVNEVNYTMEFRNSIEPTGVNIPDKMIDYVLAVGAGEIELPRLVAAGGVA